MYYQYLLAVTITLVYFYFQMVEIPSLKISKKVKSMQMFHKAVDKAIQGDRLGICVTQFDPKLLERGLVCAPGYVPTVFAVIVSMNKIRYYKGTVATKAKFHISVGHETLMAKVTIFGVSASDAVQGETDRNSSTFNFDEQYRYQEELLIPETRNGDENKPDYMPVRQYALLEFDKPTPVVPHSLVIGSRLDADIHTNVCRLAFWGHVIHVMEDKNYSSTVLPKLKVYKNKFKEGVVERAVNECELIGKSMFKKETNLQLFVGLKVTLSTGEAGNIDSSFGQSGKFKLRIPGMLAILFYYYIHLHILHIIF